MFSRIGDSGTPPARNVSYPVAPLRLDRSTLYPSESPAGDTTVDYARLWGAFSAEAGRLARIDDFSTLLTTLLALLEKYTWAVPSAAYRSRPDVSLYDHARITAALAAALYQAAPDESTLDVLLADHERRSPASAEPRFALIGGDLSGVQRFLYNIVSQGAARTLRGRSLYLQILAEAAADWLLRALDLPLPNLLYLGGARFYLLAPASALERLPALRQSVATALLDLTDGDLYLALDGVPLSAAEVARQFSRAWGRVGEALQHRKAQRFAEIARGRYDTLFAPLGAGGAVAAGDACDLCQRPLSEGSIVEGILRCHDCRERQPGYVPIKICAICRREIREGIVRDGDAVCASCEGFRRLGEVVTRSEDLFVTLSEEPPPAAAPAWQRDLYRHFGRRWDFDRIPHPERPGALVQAINRLDFRERGAHTFRLAPFVMPRVQPGERPPRGIEAAEAGAIKSFGWLGAESRGVPYLGVLRMDVDGLGRIFQHGLGDAATPSRMASLSRGLRLFFEGWLGPLVEDFERVNAAGREVIAVIYSGGDDLFVVGPWNQLPGLAHRIRTEFTAYCAGNPHLTISAGFAIADYHFPLDQFAEEAKGALDDEAKAYQRGDGRAKDAFSLLGATAGWEDYTRICGEVRNVVGLIEGTIDPSGRQRRVPRALVHNLTSVANQWRADSRAFERASRARQAAQTWTVGDWQDAHGQVDGATRLHYGRWLWLAHYQFTRFAEGLGRPDDPLRQEALGLSRRLVTPERMPTLGLVARWAEYLLRSGEE